MKRIILLIVMSMLLTACATQQPVQPTTNPFTAGKVALTLKKGVTTQTQVAEAFGAPNIVTQRDDGGSTWIYQKNSQSTSAHSKAIFATILLVSGGSNSASSSQSSRTMTLIIAFNKHDRVKSFKSMNTSF